MVWIRIGVGPDPGRFTRFLPGEILTGRLTSSAPGVSAAGPTRWCGRLHAWPRNFWASHYPYPTSRAPPATPARPTCSRPGQTATRSPLILPTRWERFQRARHGIKSPDGMDRAHPGCPNRFFSSNPTAPSRHPGPPESRQGKSRENQGGRLGLRHRRRHHPPVSRNQGPRMTPFPCPSPASAMPLPWAATRRCFTSRRAT